MAKEYAKSFYKSKAWANCRRAYITKMAGLCERCIKQGLYVPAVIVHHKEYITPENLSDPDIALNFDNLEALCQECHNKEHIHPGKMRYFVGEDGRIIPKGV